MDIHVRTAAVSKINWRSNEEAARDKSMKIFYCDFYLWITAGRIWWRAHIARIAIKKSCIWEYSIFIKGALHKSCICAVNVVWRRFTCILIFQQLHFLSALLRFLSLPLAMSCPFIGHARAAVLERIPSYMVFFPATPWCMESGKNKEITTASFFTGQVAT